MANLRSTTAALVMPETSDLQPSNQSRHRRSPLRLPPADLRGKLFRGSDVSVRCGRLRVGSVPAHSHTRAQLTLPIDRAAGIIRCFFASGESREQKLSGGQVACIPPGLLHEARWDREDEGVEIYLEPHLLARFSRRKLAHYSTIVSPYASLSDRLLLHVKSRAKVVSLKEEIPNPAYGK